MRHILLLITLALAACAAPTAGAPKTVDPAGAEALIAKKVQILDVRTAEEWSEGHLEGATRIDVQQDGFDAQAASRLDKAKPVLVYCRSGRRSTEASKRLAAAGFTEVHNLKGGILAWTADGRKVVK